MTREEEKLIREIFSAVYDLSPPDTQRLLKRAMNAFDSARQAVNEQLTTYGGGGGVGEARKPVGATGSSGSIVPGLGGDNDTDTSK